MKQSSEILGGNVYLDGELWATFSKPKCPLFSLCNCKTAMCRVCEPDESCYWYKYFKQLIDERKI